VPTGTDGTVVFDRIGRAELPGVGGLDVWWLGQLRRRGLRPAQGRERRAAGRTAAAATCSTRSRAPTSAATPRRPLVLDLNFAYNPSCAYDPAWACPLAPPGNVSDVEVPVGEGVRGRG
jgi:hypothetical protein